eukprot:8510795-Pyramimonas_sp.AAC.1
MCSWMVALGIRAMNTFSEAPSTYIRERLWTRGAKRAFETRSQIDFIGASPDICGHVAPRQDPTVSFQTNVDHTSLGPK